MANVCLLITTVVVFNSGLLGPPGDFGGTANSVGLDGLFIFANNSAARTTSKT